MAIFIHLCVDDKRKQSDELRRQITEFEMLKEQLEMKKNDLQVEPTISATWVPVHVIL